MDFKIPVNRVTVMAQNGSGIQIRAGLESGQLGEERLSNGE